MLCRKNLGFGLTTPDPNDNKFLELALTVGAEIIVSSDPDLHVLNPYRNIAILKPAEFLNAAT